jgi:hypothetical protein
MRKKFYSLVCAGFMMVMAAMQVQAADIKNVNGFSVETADYNTTVVLDENSAEGTAVGIEALLIRQQLVLVIWEREILELLSKH